nr:PilZ domain-containing protein [Sphingomonas laterariae]
MTDAVRRSTRHDVAAHISVKVDGAAPVAAILCNISRHGLVIDSLAALSEDSDIVVELIPGTQAPARFVWQDSFRSGLELVDPLKAEDYWSLLQQLDHCSDAAE